MKIGTMLHLRQDTEGIHRRVARSERFVFSHRGGPAARLEPIVSPSGSDPARNPFLNVAGRAVASPKGKSRHPASTQSSMGAREAFVDTAGFVALWDAGDDYHDRAVELQVELICHRRRFLTTDRHFEQAGFVPLLEI